MSLLAQADFIEHKYGTLSSSCFNQNDLHFREMCSVPWCYRTER